MIGEQPIRTKDTTYISAVGGIFQYKDISIIDIDQSKIILPKQLLSPRIQDNVTRATDVGGVLPLGYLVPVLPLPDCVRVEFIKYRSNPFQFIQKGNLMVSAASIHPLTSLASGSHLLDCFFF